MSSGKRSCPGHKCGKPTDDFLCPKCVTRAERDLGSLRADVNELTVTITRQSVGPRLGKRKKGDDQPLPFNQNTAEDADRALALLYEWADNIAARYSERGMPIFLKERTITGDDGAERKVVYALSPQGRVQLVAQATVILLRHAQAIGTMEDGPDLASAIWHVRSTLRRLSDRPAERVFAGRCTAMIPSLTDPNLSEDDKLAYGYTEEPCGTDMHVTIGSTTVTCPECQAVYPVGELESADRSHRNARLLAALEHRLMPLPLIVAALPALIGVKLDKATVRQWRARGLLQPSPGPWGMQQLYRGGDVLELALDEQPRPGPRRRDQRTA